jgi:outer membrane protein TolC
MSIKGSQTVYDGYPGGRSTGLVKEAKYTFQIAQLSYDAALESLAYQVKQAYYTLLGDQKSLIAKEATVKAAEVELSQMQGYLAAGRATSLDVLQFQVALTQAQLDLRSAQNTIDTDRRKLSLVVGWPLDKTYIVSDAPVPKSPSLDPKQALETAFKSRSELRTYDLEITYAGVDLALQKSSYSPSVSLNGSLGLAQDLRPDTIGVGTVSLGATIALPPLYDGKQQSSLMQQKSNAVESYRIQMDQERQSISIVVQNDLFTVKDASDRLDLAKETVEEDQGLYDMQRAKFRAGTASSVDVMTAFSNLATAQVGLETAKSTYNLAILTLINDMGL